MKICGAQNVNCVVAEIPCPMWGGILRRQRQSLSTLASVVPSIEWVACWELRGHPSQPPLASRWGNMAVLPGYRGRDVH